MTDRQNPFQQFILLYGPDAGPEAPERFVEEVLGVVPDKWQRKVLRAFGRGERYISIRACHGPGKTALAAWLIVLMVLTRYPQKTVATAPSASQLKGALLPEVKMWLNRLPQALQALFDVKAEGIYLKADPNASFFEARTARAENPEALQGVHSEYVLLVADEASGVPEQIFESASGSMSGHNATTLLLSNPVRTSGFFYDTHHRNADQWFTVRVSAFDSPRVTDDFVEYIANQYGEDSSAYRVRVLGEFPLADQDTVIPFELVEGARERDIVTRRGIETVWGVDVARFGDDTSALVKRTSMEVLPDILEWSGADIMETAGRVKAEWDETPESERPIWILVDVIGLGAGVVDRLRELNLPVRGINVGETAGSKEKYSRSRDELWFEGREWLQTKDHKLPKHDEECPCGDVKTCPREKLARELVIPKYGFTSSGKIQVESKDEMKKRGEKSPNIADAYILTFAADPAGLVHGSGDRRRMGLNRNEPLSRGRVIA